MLPEAINFDQLELIIYNAQGSIVYRKSVQQSSSTHTLDQQLSKGIYLLELQSVNGSSSLKKLVLN